VAVQDTYHDGRFNQEHFKTWGIQSVLVVPILIQEEVIGAIYFNYHHSTFSFEERHINFGLQLSSTLSLAIQNSRLIEQLKAELVMVKHTKDSLQANQKKLADILSSINDGFFECDREWRITYLNRIAATILDYQGKRLLGKNLWEAFPSLLGTKHETYYRQVMEKRRYAHFEIQDADAKKCFDVRVHPSKAGITVNWVDISEQKNMDEAIRKQANKLQEQASMLDLAHILVRDMNSKIIYWNRGAEELYGYSKEEALGKISHKLFKTVFPESMREIERVLKERGAWEGELIHTRRDGTKMYVASHQVVHLDAEGQPAAIIEVNNDITGQKQFEQSLKESEEKFRALADSNPLIIWMTDSEGGVNFVNRSYRDYFGVSLEQVQGGQWQPLVHPDEAPGYIEKFMRSLKEHTSFAAEVRVRHANGEWRWIESYGEPRLSTKGEFLGYVGNSQDITERKQAEQALRKSEKEARERALELATIMDTVPAIIWIARDPRCQTMVGNRFGQEFLGMPSGANISKSAPSQALSQQPYKTYQGKREIAPEELPMQIAASIGVSTKDYEFDLRFSDGETKTLLGDIAPLLDEKGRPSGAVAAFVDITERKKMEQALEEANSQLEQRVRERTQELEQALANEKLLQQEIIQSEKFAALARLVASVAHEINNPLQTIQNCLFLLQSDAAPGISQDAVQMAITEGRRIGTLVQQLRETYRPSIEARITDFDLIELLNNVHLLVDPKLKENRINWKTENWPERLNINGIRDQMKQVFLNICLNAIDAMESQGGELTVDISIPPDEPKVCIAFKDTGMGIEQELLSQLFEPFITTKEKGTGLGLTICYEIIKNHGGDITVESVVGEGTTFEVWVPKK
jgi:PAS domain S-box-containing protein